MTKPLEIPSELERIVALYTAYMECDEYHIHSDYPEEHIVANADPDDGHIEFDEVELKAAIEHLIAEAENKAIPKLVNEMQLDMRLQFDAKKHDFATFDAMLSYMNGWVADRLATLTNTESKT